MHPNSTEWELQAYSNLASESLPFNQDIIKGLSNILINYQIIHLKNGKWDKVMKDRKRRKFFLSQLQKECMHFWLNLERQDENNVKLNTNCLKHKKKKWVMCSE